MRWNAKASFTPASPRFAPKSAKPVPPTARPWAEWTTACKPAANAPACAANSPGPSTRKSWAWRPSSRPISRSPSLSAARFGALGRGRRRVGSGRHDFLRHRQLVVPTGNNFIRTIQHGGKALIGDIGRVHARLGGEFGVLGVGAAENFRISDTRKQAGDGDAAILELVAKGERERMQKGLAGIVK